MHDNVAEFKKRDAQLIAIDPHESHRVRQMLRDVGTKPDEVLYPVLADPVSAVSATYGVAFQMNNHTEWSNRPATFVLVKEGVLRFEKRGTAFNDRPKPADLFAEIDKLGKKKKNRRLHAGRDNFNPLTFWLPVQWA